MLPATEKVIFMNNAIITCAKKIYMIKHNINKVKASRRQIVPVVAECNCVAAKSSSADQAAGLTMKTNISA